MNKLSFRHLIIFEEEKDGTQNGIPGRPKWVEFTRAWADIKTLKGYEAQNFITEGHEITIRFIMRYTPDLTPRMRLTHNNKYYDIVSVLNDDELNKTTTIVAKKRV